MHAKSTALGHVVVHDAEDTLLHLASVRGAQDNELLGREVDGYGSLVADVLDLRVGDELARVHDCEVGAAVREVLLDRLEFATDQHLLHEEGVVGSAGDHTCLDPVLFIPAGVAIDDEDLYVC